VHQNQKNCDNRLASRPKLEQASRNHYKPNTEQDPKPGHETSSTSEELALAILIISTQNLSSKEVG
jgi:hypothetical protein